MRSCVILISVACLAAAAGCTTPSTQAPTTDAQGIQHYTVSRVSQHIVCNGHPIVLEGDRSEMTLTGACRLVTLAGSHNDVAVGMAPGGSFVITGSHNDVSWSQAEPGPPPSMQDKGDSNTYHVIKSES